MFIPCSPLVPSTSASNKFLLLNPRPIECLMLEMATTGGIQSLTGLGTSRTNFIHCSGQTSWYWRTTEGTHALGIKSLSYSTSKASVFPLSSWEHLPVTTDVNGHIDERMCTPPPFAQLLSKQLGSFLNGKGEILCFGVWENGENSLYTCNQLWRWKWRGGEEKHNFISGLSDTNIICICNSSWT